MVDVSCHFSSKDFAEFDSTMPTYTTMPFLCCFGLWIVSIAAFNSVTHSICRKKYQLSNPIVARLEKRLFSRATLRYMAQVSQAEAQAGINKVVDALRRDKTANTELGRLEKVTIVLGYGSPTPGELLLRFNASFKKSGKGLSAVPLPFMLGQSDEPAGRGTMVGQVKASVSTATGKVTSCSVFRDLGYGRAFNLKV